MKTYIRLKQQKYSTPKHKTIRTTTIVYKITGGGGGGGLKPVLQGPNLTLIFCSGSEHLVSSSVFVVNPFTSQDRLFSGEDPTFFLYTCCDLTGHSSFLSLIHKHY